MERWRGWHSGWGAIAAAGVLLTLLASCSKQHPPEKPLLRTTKAFDGIFGELPQLPLPATAYATVAYFPSSLEPEKFRPVPTFSVEQGKEEELAVRTVIRGIGTVEGPAGALLAEIVHPFPDGSDLSSLTDEAGKTTFGAEAGDAEIVDIGAPKILGLLAARDEGGKPPDVLSVLFDRPVFVEDAEFSDAGDGVPYPGKVYSTGFGMSLEFHPEGEVGFDPSREYRVRLTVRDGKGRKTSVEEKWRPKGVTRH